jgi:hypothetical protein
MGRGRGQGNRTTSTASLRSQTISLQKKPCWLCSSYETPDPFCKDCHGSGQVQMVRTQITERELLAAPPRLVQV